MKFSLDEITIFEDIFRKSLHKSKIFLLIYLIIVFSQQNKMIGGSLKYADT